MDDEADARQRFQLAFRTGSLRLIENAARGLPVVSLDDALRILVVMAEKGDERYGRASARWVSRAIAERNLNAGQAQDALTLVAQLPDRPEAADKLRRCIGLRRLGS